MGLVLPPQPHSPKRSFTRLAPQLSRGSRCPRDPRAPGRQEIPPRGSGSTGCGSGRRGLSTNPGRQQVVPTAPLRRQGLRCGERGGGSSVPPRNTRKTLPQLKFNKAIRSNTAAYLLNTRYFCNPCSASALSPSLFACVPAPPPDGRALQLRADGGTDRPRSGAPAAPSVHGC